MSAIVFLPLSQGKVTTIDFEDFEKFGRVKWHAERKGRRGKFYAARNINLNSGRRTTSSLHREILSASPGMDVDHRNGDSLDNRRDNLRECGHANNCRNMVRHIDGSSQFKGVWWNRQNKNWRTRICVAGELLEIGSFDCELTAAQEYDKMARKHFGEFACCNFPLTPNQSEKENESSIIR